MYVNNIYNYALQKGEFQIETLCELCDQMEPGMKDRFITALLGIVDYHAVVAGLPRKQTLHGRECTFDDANYLADEVNYSYDETDVRYFENQKDADTYSKDGSGYFCSESRPDEKHTIEATHSYHRHSSCNFNRWIEGDAK